MKSIPLQHHFLSVLNDVLMEVGQKEATHYAPENGEHKHPPPEALESRNQIAATVGFFSSSAFHTPLVLVCHRTPSLLGGSRASPHFFAVRVSDLLGVEQH